MSVILSQLSDLEFLGRLGGSTRYATSQLIAEWTVSHGLTAIEPAIATGENYPDALAGAALQGKNDSVLVLVKNGNSPGISMLADNKDVIEHGYVFGGTGAVSDALAESVAEQTEMVFEK